MATGFTAHDVLAFLDRCLKENPAWAFIDLEHPYVYTANSRLTLYADETRWAIVSEVSGYNPRAARFSLTLTYLGNCLERLAPAGDRGQYTWNIEFITLIDQQSMTEVIEHFTTSAEPVLVTIRDRSVQVPSTTSTFIPNTESRPWPKGAREEDVGRYVAYEYADLCRATDMEKRAHLPSDLPELMIINEWHHRRWYYIHSFEPIGPSGEAPSSYETFRLLAEVLASRDPSRYWPTLRPNSHWSNWPQAGAL